MPQEVKRMRKKVLGGIQSSSPLRTLTPSRELIKAYKRGSVFQDALPRHGLASSHSAHPLGACTHGAAPRELEDVRGIAPQDTAPIRLWSSESSNLGILAIFAHFMILFGVWQRVGTDFDACNNSGKELCPMSCHSKSGSVCRLVSE